MVSRQPFVTILATCALTAVFAAMFAVDASARQLPDGPGKTELQKVCGTCNQPERAASVRITREGWEAVLADMVQRGAKGTDEEFAAVLDYLAKNFLGDAPKPLNINRANNVEL